MTELELETLIREAIPVYKDWPKEGVNFLNTVELCNQPYEFDLSVNWFADEALLCEAQAIFAADARGFIWGGAAAIESRLPMHVIRKAGKLPGKTHKKSYQLEYGTDTMELGEVKQKYGPVMIIDDVLATGGTALAMCELLHEALGIPYNLITLAVLVNLTFLPGESLLKAKGVNLVSLVNE